MSKNRQDLEKNSKEPSHSPYSELTPLHLHSAPPFSGCFPTQGRFK